jgi:hypothetical protein
MYVFFVYKETFIGLGPIYLIGLIGLIGLKCCIVLFFNNFPFFGS